MKSLLVRFLSIFLIAISLLSCNSYDKILKSNDVALKLKMADDFYKRKKYPEAIQFYDNLLNIYRGTSNAENILFKMGLTFFNMNDFPSASFYFKLYNETYPLGQFAEDCYFNNAVCYYKESPVIDLDQTNSKKSIEAYQLFMDKFPNSEKVEQANKQIDELKLKIEKKSYNNAYLYFKTKEYKSAVWALRKHITEYPYSEEREYIYSMIVKSSYWYAEQSVLDKQKERYEKVLDYIEEIDEQNKGFANKSEIVTIKQSVELILKTNKI